MPADSLPPDYNAARVFCDGLLEVLAQQSPNMANLVRAFIELDEKRQNTPPRSQPIERISVSLERWAEGWAFVQVRALHNGTRYGVDERLNMRDVERSNIDLAKHALSGCIVKVARECEGNWAVAEFMAYIAKGKL